MLRFLSLSLIFLAGQVFAGPTQSRPAGFTGYTLGGGGGGGYGGGPIGVGGGPYQPWNYPPNSVPGMNMPCLKTSSSTTPSTSSSLY